MLHMTLYDRIYGCLLGGACGDALGAPVEFLRQEQIVAQFGPNGITTFSPAYGGLGLITDDTQMTLFTVEGLIRATVRGASKGIWHPPGTVHHAYKRWYLTQTEPFDRLANLRKSDGWLIREKRLWASRAPGATCLSALQADLTLGRYAQNDSKGCGTVMRDAPFGFLWWKQPDKAFQNALEAAWTTHGHPSARYSSGALAAIIAHLTSGEALPAAVNSALALLEPATDADEVHRALTHAVKLSALPDWRERLPELGEGWVAEEALAIAVLCALAAKNVREAIIAAVNHSGDSDSTGAIAGNIVGTIHGPSAIPAEWADQVELRDVIETLAKDFAMIAKRYGITEEQAETFWDRYPGW